MTVRKTIAASLGALAATATPAAEVVPYGVLDVGVEYINSVTNTGATMWRVPSATNTMGSRFGVRGSEALGRGIEAVFTIEAGIDPGTGGAMQGGRMWGRQTFVGLKGAYGTVSLGRQYSTLFWSGLNADIYAGAIYSTASLDLYMANPRVDNALAWRAKFGGFSLGATYSLGRDAHRAGAAPALCAGEQPGDANACKQWSAMLMYDSAWWGVGVANDRLYGRNPATATEIVPGGLDDSGKTDNRLVFNGWIRLGTTKLGAGVIRRSNDGTPLHPDSDLWYLGVVQPITERFELSAQALTRRYRHVDDYDSNMIAARATYAFSKRSAVYLQSGYIRNEELATASVSAGAPGSHTAPGGSQFALNAGIRHIF